MTDRKRPGRPPIYAPGQRQEVRVRLDAELVVAVDAAAVAAGMTRGEWVAEALREYLNRDADE